ncbi:MAG TPA: Gfo/Idh/MocA family oxidoreductase, partial [Methylomirabilota bacterium]|nr:Gfo/Idh/MocA family oxidoreductase [Methylomirabilota bacterium]
MSSTPLSRRRFIYSSAALAAAAALPAFGQRTRKVPANEKLNIAIIGAGGRGAENLKGVSTENIVALCDVDMERAADAFKQYPAAAQYTDWRRLLDREKNIDAVVISTPDHTHATIAAAALRAGKHVYCEKPLTRTIYEARTLQNLASKGRLVTQMGQQGHATEGTRRLVETLRSGALGDVTEVHVWTDRPAGWWPQGVTRPRQRPRIPQTLDWDLWLGP